MAYTAQIVNVILTITICITLSKIAKAGYHENDEFTDMKQTILDIQAKQRNYGDELSSQRKTIEDQARKIAKLEQLLQTRDKIQSNVLSDDTVKIPTKVRRQVGGVAFSTYIDHSVDLGPNQVLKFNRIITNEGNGYNVHTGSFTCPEGGMYLLTFFIGEKGTDVPDGAWISLMLNSVNVMDAASDAYHSDQDLQGGNAVIIRLKAGDVVFVNNGYGSTVHAEGTSGLRLTSFSGVKLFA